MPERKSYGAKEICQLADISLRQLGYWKLIGVINPREEVRENKAFYRYSERDLQILKAIKRLTKEGYLVSRAAARIQAILDAVGNDPEALLRALELPPEATASLAYFQRRFREEVQRARRFAQPLSCLAIRIRQLDPKIAPEAMNEIERLLGATRRAYDVLARVELGEFLILLPQTGDLGAKTVASRVHRLLTERDILVQGRRIVFQAQVAIATADANSDEREQLVDLARRQFRD
jgi:DNA-binding transcriptional MerR regulator